MRALPVTEGREIKRVDKERLSGTERKRDQTTRARNGRAARRGRERSSGMGERSTWPQRIRGPPCIVTRQCEKPLSVKEIKHINKYVVTMKCFLLKWYVRSTEGGCGTVFSILINKSFHLLCGTQRSPCNLSSLRNNWVVVGHLSSPGNNRVGRVIA